MIRQRRIQGARPVIFFLAHLLGLSTQDPNGPWIPVQRALTDSQLPMQIYFFTAGVDSHELRELEDRIRSKLPNLQNLPALDEVTRQLAPDRGSLNREPIYVICPVLNTTSSLDRFLNLAEQEHRGVFLIFISSDISASDYKRLVRGGSADWASLHNAPQEILEILSRTGQSEAPSVEAKSVRPAMVAFVPSGGGVGNATLALETAVQIKLNKQMRGRRVCLLDLDLQSSHVCDYLDIEPRLQMQEIVQDPNRLDAQLFGLFVSRHQASGVEVLASPRDRNTPTELPVSALDALFRCISEHYDLTIIDLPAAWFDWTGLILSTCDLAIVTGLNNVPGLRQVAETLQAMRNQGQVPPQIVVALNRCETDLLGNPARRGHVNRVLGRETVVYVRDDAAAANHSLNTGVPISITSRSSKIAKDVRILASLVARVRPDQLQLPGSSTPRRP
jgi:pilus assembly protein CpaE